MSSEPDVYIGIEGGGTRTVAIASDSKRRLIHRQEFGPGNPLLLSEQRLHNLFAEIATRFPKPRAIGIGMAGIRAGVDEKRVRVAAHKVWGMVSCAVTHDLEIALRAAAGTGEVRVLVLSGTGSCCYGRAQNNRSAKVGGWGHLLGDIGSGYDIALQGLRTAVYEFDRNGRWTVLGQQLLRALQLTEPGQLIAWIQQAEKAEVARLAGEVFSAAAGKDKFAERVISVAAESLARDALSCANGLASKNEPVTFVLAGGVLQNQPSFARRIARKIRAGRLAAEVRLLEREGAWGAIECAVEAAATGHPLYKRRRPERPGLYVPEFVLNQSPTEQRNPESMRFDELSIAEMVQLFFKAEEAVIPALASEERTITRLAAVAAKKLRQGGRLFYVGAGTSGRLGVLDASEIPPTFRAPPEMVQGIIAGGQRALWQAVEGAEDDAAAGADAIRFRGAAARDLVVGIAASGRTPFVWGALAEARKRGAATALVCFNPRLGIAREHRPDIVVAPNVGPEILTGSTRLKCGTATKLILNMTSTIAMVRLGKVLSNLMVDLNPSNVKLRDRAVRIVQDLTDSDRAEALKALERSDWVVKKAWADLSRRRRR